jgi:hypothetical protein
MVNGAMPEVIGDAVKSAFSGSADAVNGIRASADTRTNRQPVTIHRDPKISSSKLRLGSPAFNADVFGSMACPVFRNCLPDSSGKRVLKKTGSGVSGNYLPECLFTPPKVSFGNASGVSGVNCRNVSGVLEVTVEKHQRFREFTVGNAF